MTGWLVFMAVGAGSYLFRVGPLLTRRTAAMPARLDRAVQHAGTAALAALLVSAVTHADASLPLPLVLAGTVAGLAVAVRGHSMLVVMGIGVGAVAAARLATVGLSTIGLLS